MGLLKKAGIGIAIFVIVLGIIFTIPIEDLEEIRAQNTQPNETKTITVDASSLLPTRYDLGTTWTGIGNIIYDEAENVVESKGFLEKAEKHYSRGSGFETEFLDVYVYKFDSSKNASAFYQEFVSEWRQKGGFEEWFPVVSDADCYGRKVSEFAGDKIAIYCVENNIVTFYLSAGYAWKLIDDLEDLAKSIHGKF